MAVRLSVVMVQSTPPTPNAERVAEAIVGELIGLSGIDLTLVEPLDQLGTASTDHLTLSSLSGDIAVLDWQTPEQTDRAFSRLGIEGKRAPHPHDAAAAASPQTQRKFYLFDLNAFEDAKAVLTALQELNASRSVRTFSLGLGRTSNTQLPVAGPTSKTTTNMNEQAGSGISGATRPGAESATGRSEETGASAAFESSDKTPGSVSASTSGRRTVDQTTAASSHHSSGADSDLDLDELIDQLDQLDP